MILGIHHVAIATRDLDRLVAFYREHFGFTVCAESGWQAGNERIDRMVGLKDSAARYAMIRLGTFYIEVFEFSAPEGRPNDRRLCDVGLTHLCLYCDDVFAEYERLTAAGMRFHCPPGGEAATRATYGRDCDGNVVELLQIVDPACAFSFIAPPARAAVR